MNGQCMQSNFIEYAKLLEDTVLFVTHFSVPTAFVEVRDVMTEIRQI